MPAFDGDNYLVWVCSLDERLWVLIMLFAETVDGCLKVNDYMEDAGLETSACQFRKEPFDGV